MDRHFGNFKLGKWERRAPRNDRGPFTDTFFFDLCKQVECPQSKKGKYLKGYALCRRPLLTSRDCHLGALVPPFLTFWEPFWHLGSTLGDHFTSREHLGRPFWHLGTTLEDHGSSRMDTKLQITGFLSILDWCRDLFVSVFGVQNVLKMFFVKACFQVIFYRSLNRTFNVWDF